VISNEQVATAVKKDATIVVQHISPTKESAGVIRIKRTFEGNNVINYDSNE
jgi:hypothetical protein